MTENIWLTKNNIRIKYKDLKNNHLLNILKFIEQKAKEGLMIRTGGGMCPDDFWYDEYEIIDEEVLEHFNYKELLKEAKKRKLDIKQVWECKL